MNDDRAVHCVHARACGGCPLIERPYGEQLVFKRDRVRAALALYPAHAKVEVAAPRGAEAIEGYRTRAKFAVGPAGAIGMYAEGHAVVDVPACRVVSDAMRVALDHLRAAAKAKGEPALTAAADGGALRAVDLRSVRDPSDPARELLTLTLVLDRRRATVEDASRACEDLYHQGVAASCAVSWHDGRSPQLLGAAPEVLAGPRALRDVVGQGDLWLHVSPGSFAQAHRGTSAAIHALARSALSAVVSERRRARVLELYAGSGALGLSLARGGMNVTLVESFAPAADAAVDAAREQRIEGVRVFAEDAARFAREEACRGERYDAVVINPPRRGVDRGALEAIGALDPTVVLYVSCDPETLARDLATLRDAGFAVMGGAQPFDMIPLTEEVETVVVLRQLRGEERAGVSVVHRDERLVVLDGGSGVARRALEWARRELRWRDAVAFGGAGDDESGLTLVARTAADAQAIERERIVSDLRAEAWVKSVARDKGSIERPALGVRDARTRYKRLAVVGGHSKVRLVIERGDTLTARAHMASLAHPVLGDSAHGERGTNVFVRERMALDRTALHVSAVTVRDGDATLALSAASSGDLALLEARLGRR
jgi:23S rRNA (uracil1939-C5)-methyltransferase